MIYSDSNFKWSYPWFCGIVLCGIVHLSLWENLSYIFDFYDCIPDFGGAHMYICIPRQMPIIYMIMMIFRTFVVHGMRSYSQNCCLLLIKPSLIGIHRHKTFCSVGLNRELLSTVLALITIVLTFIIGCPSQSICLNHRPPLNKDVKSFREESVCLTGSSNDNCSYNELQNLGIAIQLDSKNYL